MNIDDRLEFLTKNVESLHQSVSELTEAVSSLTATVQEHERRWAQLMPTFRAALEAWLGENGEQPGA
jgi:prefoldin subunit 5